VKRAALLATGVAVAGVLSAEVARAAPPWVDRTLTLPSHDWAFDFGLGIAHVPDVTGPGLNIEGAVSPIRTGIRLNEDAQAIRADQYGRLFDRQTFGTGNDTFANPEFRVTGEVLRSRIVELGLEGRVYLPLEDGTHAGIMAGMPLRFHLGDSVRIDTGVYVPIVFSTPTDTHFSAPFDLWIQASNRLWLGPMSGFVYNSLPNTVDISLGFGLGYQILRTLDLKTMLLFPDINHNEGSRDFGMGVGIQVRIE